MLFKRIESEGIAHYSYLIGNGRAAVVIDPRLDCDIYGEDAHSEGFRIHHILETHRHEDFVLGSVALASRTGADIWHADNQWSYKYGKVIKDGQTWKIGRLKLEAIHSPGHTPGSMSYLLYDPDGAPWMVFTGDALFAGDVGRVDFMGEDRIPEMAGHLYDTLFNKLLPLGDGVIVCPAHGAGSVCAGDIGDRIWTTIGLERCHNPKLQVKDRKKFIALANKKLDYPPYFRQMEKLNLEGVPIDKTYPVPLSADAFAEKAEGAVIVDTRGELSFGTSHVPKSLSIWSDGLPSFAGWFLPYDKPILLVNDSNNAAQVARYLLRLGYFNVSGFLAGGMITWQTAGRESATIETITVQSFCSLLDKDEHPWILDVRSDAELEHAGSITGANHIHITELAGRMEEVPRNRTVFVFCGSGLRSMIAASLLKREGWRDLVVVLGGMAGWRSISCPIRK
ncbi:MAG TPA: MBL fold metallo-hydrolase [Syntrophales bacterium]|nr:MBL fold metallo-hydrolase [Syntrophales bacterium]